MGQKVHPIGFRLGQTHNHSSHWFAKKKDYSKLLLEDNYLRQMLFQYSKSIDRIQIIRQYENHIEIIIIIYTESPSPKYYQAWNNLKATLILDFQNLKQFKDHIKENIQKYRQKIKAHASGGSDIPNSRAISPPPQLKLCIRNGSLNAHFVAQFLVNLLEERTSYKAAIYKFFNKNRRAINQWINEKARSPYKSHERRDEEREQALFKGIKIQISGRLNGAEIARSQWVREGRLPLQTLDANIDYCFKKASTIYGILGVKVWIFK
uniref:Small ribosomal subunit protein uS3c n=1 Tax=Caulerpa cliftonii TaxID=1004391 RepID=A0A1C9JBM0_9CHLO|nr:ribosomal protein S3 [Caulerpa cliftonii]AOP19248.1 ribosomal protein S3 [Caulerpa cliftonii]